jgi:DNA-directed RNA polymerase specialized sigma24 family protein
MSAADFYLLYKSDPTDTNLSLLLAEVRRIALSEARRLGAKREDAEDLAQGTSLKVWDRLSSGASIKSITGYVRSATRNLTYNFHRNINRTKRGETITESFSCEP